MMTVGEMEVLAQELTGKVSTRALKYLVKDLKDQEGMLAPYVYHAARSEQRYRIRCRKREELAVYYEYLKESGGLR